MIDQALRSVCVDFCNRTLQVQTLTPLDVTADTADYVISVPTTMQLVKVMGVWYEDTWLSPTSVENVRTAVALRGAIGSSTPSDGTPSTYFQDTPTSSSIRLYPVPDTTIASGLTVRAAFCPKRTATTVSDTLFEDWVDEIASGTIAKLCTMPGQTFTNKDIAQEHMAAYERAVRAASNLTRSGKAVASSRVQPVRFA